MLYQELFSEDMYNIFHDLLKLAVYDNRRNFYFNIGRMASETPDMIRIVFGEFN
jgi:hypothetical protein